MRPTLNDRSMARLRVVSAVCADAGNGLMRRYLPLQLGQHGCVAHTVVAHLNGPNLQRTGIKAQMHLAPLTPVLGPVFLSFPFAFAQKLDARAAHQQVQRTATGTAGQLHLQALLASADRTEVWHPPVQAHHAQQALHQAQTLAHRQAKHALDTQAKPDGGIGKSSLASSLAAGWRIPMHAFDQPDGQRPRALSAALYAAQLGVLQRTLVPLASAMLRGDHLCGSALCNKAGLDHYVAYTV